MTRHGASPLIGYVIVLGIMVSAGVIAVTVGQGLLTDVEDTGIVTDMITQFGAVDQAVQRVASQGRYAQQTVTIRVSKGDLSFDPDTGIVYTVNTDTSPISSGARVRQGNLVLTADADASVTNSSFNGTDCYRLRNQYLDACINLYGQNGFVSGDLDDAIVYLRHRSSNTTITPELNMSTSVPGDFSTGLMQTRVTEYGSYLGTAEATIRVKPSDLPGYELRIRLDSDADFLRLQLE